VSSSFYLVKHHRWDWVWLKTSQKRLKLLKTWIVKTSQKRLNIVKTSQKSLNIAKTSHKRLKLLKTS
jgi:hypothetical protein